METKSYLTCMKYNPRVNRGSILQFIGISSGIYKRKRGRGKCTHSRLASVTKITAPIPVFQ